MADTTPTQVERTGRYNVDGHWNNVDVETILMLKQRRINVNSTISTLFQYCTVKNFVYI